MEDLSWKEVVFILLTSIVGVPLFLLTLYLSAGRLTHLFFIGEVGLIGILAILSPLIFAPLFILIIVKLKQKFIQETEVIQKDPKEISLKEIVPQKRSRKEDIFLGFFFATLLISIIFVIFLLINDSQIPQIIPGTGRVNTNRSILFSICHNELLAFVIPLFYGISFSISSAFSFRLFKKADSLWAKIYYLNTINLILTFFYIFVAEEAMLLLLPLFSTIFISQYVIILNESRKMKDKKYFKNKLSGIIVSAASFFLLIWFLS